MAAVTIVRSNEDMGIKGVFNDRDRAITTIAEYYEYDLTDDDDKELFFAMFEFLQMEVED